MTDITRSIRKYAAAYLRRTVNICRIFSHIWRVSLCVSYIFAAYCRIFARVFAAYPAYSCVFSRIHRVFLRIHRIFLHIHPRILAYLLCICTYSRIFSRITAYFLAYSHIFDEYSCIIFLPSILTHIMSHIHCIFTCQMSHTCIAQGQRCGSTAVQACPQPLTHSPLAISPVPAMA